MKCDHGNEDGTCEHLCRPNADARLAQTIASELTCWLIWMMDGAGHVSLLAVDLTEEARDRHLEVVKYWPRKHRDDPPPRTFVEESKVNHLYGDGLQSAVGQRLTIRKYGE